MEKQTNKSQGVLIIFCILIVILIGVILYAVTQSHSEQQAISPTSNVVSQSDQVTPSVTTVSAPTSHVVSEASIALKSKCATDGQAFYLNLKNELGKPELIWWDPQFHFNSRLNTCLMYIQWNDTSIPTTYTNGILNYVQTVMNNNVVFDIYSNQTILQHETTKTYNAVNGKVQETDTLNDPLYQNTPNSSVDEFTTQLRVLMNN